MNAVPKLIYLANGKILIGIVRRGLFNTRIILPLEVIFGSDSNLNFFVDYTILSSDSNIVISNRHILTIIDPAPQVIFVWDHSVLNNLDNVKPKFLKSLTTPNRPVVDDENKKALH